MLSCGVVPTLCNKKEHKILLLSPGRFAGPALRAQNENDEEKSNWLPLLSHWSELVTPDAQISTRKFPGCKRRKWGEEDGGGGGGEC